MPHLSPRWPRLMLNWGNFAEASPKLGEIGGKLAQVGSHWQQVGSNWPKLAALVRSNLKKCSLPGQGAQKKSRDAHRTLPSSHQVATKEHTFGISCPQCPSKKIYKALSTGTGNDQRDMGQGMMTGSNMPWAKGPAHLNAPRHRRIL